jgi:hypothetical protein
MMGAAVFIAVAGQQSPAVFFASHFAGATFDSGQKGYYE